MADRKFALDYLKLMFAIGVVALHTQFLGEFSVLGEQLSVNGIFRIAVPFFITISGYYFYDAFAADQTKRWILRLGVLYAVWMLLYLPLWISHDGALASVPRIIGTIAFGYHHLWYVIAMVFAALLMTACKHWSSHTLFWLSVFLFMLGWIIQLIGIHDLWPAGLAQWIFNSSKSYRNFLFFVFPFLTTGLLLRKCALVEKFPMWKAVVMAISGAGLIVLESGLHYLYAGKNVVPLDLLVGLPLACIGLVIAAMKPISKKSTKKVALLASALYFVHPWIIHVGKAMGLDFTALTGFSILLSTPVAAAVVALSRRLKFIL